MCQDTRSGGLNDLLASAEIGHDALVDLSRKEAFEAPDDLAFGSAIGGASGDVVAGGLVESHADDDGAIEGGVGVAVAASIEAVPAGGHPGRGRDRARAAELRERGFRTNPVGVIAEDDQGSAAVWAPTPKPSRRVGAVSVVRRSRCWREVVYRHFLGESRIQRRAEARRVSWRIRMGVSTGPGRSPAQRVSRPWSVRSWRASRSSGGACTMICFSVFIAVVRAFTAVSRVIFSWRIISTAPAVLGMAVDCPASADRAATSASMVSDLPAAHARAPVAPIHFHDPMPRAAHRTCQAAP